MTKKIWLLQEYNSDDDSDNGFFEQQQQPLSSKKQHPTPACEYQVIMANNDDDGDDRQPTRTVTLQQRSSFSSAAAANNNSSSSKKSFTLLLSTLQQIATDLFLPIGYPHCLADDNGSCYLEYQLYDGLQGLCSYWRGVVAVKAVLEGAGVGRTDATALSAAVQWALRDGAGMVGGLLYSYRCSRYLDAYALEFRLLLADVINDVALTCDMLVPYLQGNTYIVVGLLSTLGKTVCGITAGATKGRITHHFSRHSGNMADLTAKESTQETLVSLLGMLGGVLVAQGLERTHHTILWTWILFLLLTLLHVWANYRAVSVIHLTTLNPERVKCLFHDFIQQAAAKEEEATTTKKVAAAAAGGTKKNKNTTTTTASQQWQQGILDTLPSPDQIRESLWRSTYDFLFPTIRVRDSLATTLPQLDACTLWMTTTTMPDALELHDTMPYILGMKTTTTKRRSNQPILLIYIWLTRGATAQEQVQAYVHALLLQEILSQKGERASFNDKLVSRYGLDLFPLL
jgi:Vitamin B6 photo-protection and homoeostasis